MKVISSGKAYVDIDALACSLAYKSYLTYKKECVEVCHSGPFNSTIPYWIDPNIFHIYNGSRYVEENKNINCIIVDVSDPAYFEDFVKENNIIEIYDHHLGFESDWCLKKQIKVNIEKIGACATLIWETIKSDPLCLNVEVAELLYLAIVSNTLNFSSCITHSRDINAAHEISSLYSIDEQSIKSKYYHSNDVLIYNNLIKSLELDMKKVNIKSDLFTVFQLEMFLARNIIENSNQLDKIKNILNKHFMSFLNLVDIENNRSYFISMNNDVVSKLENHFSINEIVPFVYCHDHCVLRKEIIHKMMGV